MQCSSVDAMFRGLCLALNSENLPNTNAGGVLTTSTGLGSTLIDRLKNAEVLFEGPSKV